MSISHDIHIVACDCQVTLYFDAACNDVADNVRMTQAVGALSDDFKCPHCGKVQTIRAMEILAMAQTDEKGDVIGGKASVPLPLPTYFAGLNARNN